MTADSGEIYTAGKYYNLVPIANELYSPVFNGNNIFFFRKKKQTLN
jgi:hypothetical protein